MFVIPLKVQINSYHDRVGESSADDGFLTALRTHIHESKPRWNGACSGIQVPPSSTMTTAEGADIASKRLLSDLKRLNMLRRYCLLPSEQTHSPGGGNQHYALLISGELHPSVPKRTGFASCFTTANNRENCEGYSDPLWGYKMMKEYHASLTEAEKRGFPVTDEGRFSETGMDGGGKQIGLEVSWKSAFDTSRTVRRSNIRYERACVLFNIAALESYIGAKSDRSTVAGTDEAIKRFQNAAGIFKHLTLLEVDPSNMKPDPENNYKPDIDLNKDCLTMLEYLMLAQAQACMFEKVCKHQPVAANATTSRLKVWWHCLSKIAMGASVLYEKAFSHSNSEFFALYIDSRWSYSMKAWLAAFKAISQYWQSFIDEERAKAAKGAGYGNCLGRLQLSMDFMNNDVLPNSRKAGMDVATFEDYIRNISERLLEVEYDNSTCIREKTVEPYALNKIPHTTITIPRDFDQHFFAESLSKRLFVGMLSIRAMEKYTEFSILSSNLYEKVRKEIDKIESRIIKACHSKNIENNLEIFNETGGISVSLWGKVTATRKQKEVREVLDTYVQFQVTSADVKIKIGDLDNHFRNVINEHETYRNNNSATHLTNAKEKGEALSVELSNTKGKLDEASKIDAMINSNIKYQDLQEKSRTIMMDKSELDLKFPSMTQEESEVSDLVPMEYV
uniref:BRO1 domain-containing protein n=1 Tax=Corethron hystrix TaxID=216773 RepID=A0A7S1BC92_9STRA